MKKSLLFSSYRHILVFSLLLFFTVASCREDDPSPGSQNAKVNDWILENMQFWYLWNEQLPGNTNKNTDPESFFESLLVSEDRFSWIQDDYQELLNSLQGISEEAGYEFALYRETEGSENVIGQIVYTKPASPAVQAGLKRGDVFTHINGLQLTTTNYQSLLEAIHENHSLTYKPLIIGEERFDGAQTISLSTVEYAEDPNYYHGVIETDDKKIGYYVYNFFASGTDSDTAVYDTEMKTIFADFKAKGITDFILDLRFNSGGSEKAAANLASLIGKDINDTKIFAKRAYNTSVENEILNDPELGEEFLSTRFSNESGNIGSMLGGGRVYVLTSSRTASASELVINALKPFMEVYLIGDVTYGKNVGSISLYDRTDASNKWGLQPIVVKVYNSLDQSDYANGFTPDVLHDDNGLHLYPLGDTREALLALAIGQITGTSSSGRMAAGKQMKSRIGHSLDEKRRSYNLVIDHHIPF